MVFWIIFACFLGSGRSAKILEDPIVPQSSSYEVISHSDSKGNSLQDNSDRSLSAGNNMMLYRTVFSMSLRLLTCFLVVRLLGYALTSAGILKRTPAVPFAPFPGEGVQSIYTVDVNHNPGLALNNGVSTIAYGGGDVGSAAVGSTLLTTGGAHAVSTGAAAGASTGTAPVQSHYLAAGTQLRPSYLPLGPPPPRSPFRLFGFGGPRHPPRRPPPHMMPHSYVPVSQHNLGEETQYIDTHTHLIVMPDGTQARVPNTVAIQTPKPQQTANTASSSSSSSSSNTQQDSKSSASGTSENSTDRPPVESTSVSTSTAERRSSNVFKDRSSSPYIAHQPYDDWSLHFNAGA